MLDPNGPLPPAVYWRRRAVAISVSVLVVALLGWGVVALTTGTGEPSATTQQHTARPPEQPVAVAADSGPEACPDQTLRVASEAGHPTFRTGERIGLAVVVTNIGPRPCVRDLNRMLREIEVTTPAGRHVWSSNDCYAESTNERPVLEPGKPVRNDVLWQGLSSEPGCTARQERVPPGDYLAVARLTSIASAPTPFRVIP